MAVGEKKTPLDYAEWLAQTVVDFGDSPEFNLGPIDRQTLARALLHVLPVARLADEVESTYTDPLCTSADHRRAVQRLYNAVQLMRARLAGEM